MLLRNEVTNLVQTYHIENGANRDPTSTPKDAARHVRYSRQVFIIGCE